ncbi:hypothetical protein [Paludisphaera sp.]|uniref:hypothetical protein n=1 Tax=Paludisphaera sp. TaxID=2017432 RepID=UPI00301DDBCD
MSTSDAAPNVSLDGTTRDEPSAGRLAAFALIAALLASLASWGAVEAVHDRLEPRAGTFKGIPTTAEMEVAGTRLAADLAWRGSLAFGLLGGLLGLALGAAGGFARDRTRGGIVAGVVGGVLGAAAGAVSARIGFERAPKLLPPMMDDLLAAILAQGVIGALIGAAAGTALALGSGRGKARGAIGGLVGGAAGLALHQVIGAAAFPLAATTEPLAATPLARLTGHVLPAALAAVGAALALTAGPRRPRSPGEAA